MDGSSNPKQLKEFIQKTKVPAKILINKKDLDKERKKSLEDRRELYRDKMDEFVEHSKMDALKYFTKVLNKPSDKKGNIIQEAENLSFNKILPIPKELLKYTSPVRPEFGEDEIEFQKRVKRCEKKYGADDWYNWSVNHYGTKWEVKAEITGESNDYISYSFDSAWSPPIEFFKNISPLFPKLIFELEYEEGGSAIEGTATIQDGEVDDDCRDYVERCEECNEKDKDVEWDENLGQCLCPSCKEEMLANNPHLNEQNND